MPDLIQAHKEEIITNTHISADTRTWVSLADKDSPQHLNSTRRGKALSLSRSLAVSSLLYGRLLDAYCDFIVPSDMYLAVPDGFPDSLNKQLDWIWNSGPSALRENARELVQTLFIDGEVILKPRVNTGDGRVTLTDYSCDSITDIQLGEGIDVVKSITLNLPTDGDKYNEEEYDVIRRDSSMTLDGEVFYFRMKPAGYTAGVRGLPLLIRGLDDIASGSELIYNRLTRLARLATHYWDVTLKGATQKTVDDFLASENSIPPESGEVFAHNETALWNLVSEDIPSIEDEVELFINLIIGGAGLTPEFMGHSLTRDLTTEALFSAFARLSAIQWEVKNMFEKIIEFSLENAKSLDGKYNGVARVMTKEIGSRISQRQASALRSFVTAISEADESGLVERDAASKAISELLLKYDVLSRHPDYKPFDASTQNTQQGAKIR